MAAKWFYKLQKESEDRLLEKYDVNGYCLWQDVTKDRVFEAWDVTRKLDGVRTVAVVVMQKFPELITICEAI